MPSVNATIIPKQTVAGSSPVSRWFAAVGMDKHGQICLLSRPVDASHGTMSRDATPDNPLTDLEQVGCVTHLSLSFHFPKPCSKSVQKVSLRSGDVTILDCMSQKGLLHAVGMYTAQPLVVGRADERGKNSLSRFGQKTGFVNRRRN